MPRSSCYCLLIASLVFVSSAERIATRSTVCSITEKTEDFQYGVSFADDVKECTDARCNVFHIKSIIKRQLKHEKLPNGKCICKGVDGKRLFGFKPMKGQECGVSLCWDQYSMMMKSIFARQKTSPLTWLSSLSHFDATCEEGTNNVPSIEEAIVISKEKNKITPEVEQRMGDIENDMKDDDDILVDDDDLEGEEEGGLDEDDELADCQDLPEAVSDAAARAAIEKEAVSKWEQTVYELEETVPLEKEKVEEHKKQYGGFSEKYTEIVETEGGRTCSISEIKDHYQYGVSFAYTMTQSCTKARCSIFAWKSSHLKEALKGKCRKEDKGKCTKCSCSLHAGGKAKHLFTFKPSSLYSCGEQAGDPTGCWGFYASIRRIGEQKKLAAADKGVENWLDSQNHWEAKCDEGAVSMAISAAELVKELRQSGGTDEADELEKQIDSEEDEADADGGSSSEDAKNLDDQKEKCPNLATKLAAIEQELSAHQSLALDKKEMAQELETVMSSLHAEKDEYAEKIKQLMKKLTAAEIASLPEGPVKK